MIKNQIYNYFERNEDMHVLFIFDRMDYIGVELRDAEWKDGYRYVTFDGKWFTTKYNIHNEWKDDRVILLFPPESQIATHEASASMCFVGNTKHTVPYMLKNSHLFESIPTSFIKGAFLDRIHLYNPGWEIKMLKKDSFSKGYGLITDYIAAILHEMRNLDLTSKLNEYAQFDSSLSERDHLAIRKTFSGLIKLIYPDGNMTKEEAINYDKEFNGCPYCNAKTFYICGRCGKIVCYNGEEYVTCPNCGGVGTVAVAESYNLSGGGF